MQLFNSKKIRTQFNIIILACIITIIIFQICYINYVNIYVRRQLYDSIDSSMNQMKISLEDNIDNMTEISYIPYYSDVILNFLYEDELAKKIPLKAGTENLISYIKSSNSNILDIFIMDNSGISVNADRNVKKYIDIETIVKQAGGDIETPTLLTLDDKQLKMIYTAPVYDIKENNKAKIGIVTVISNANGIRTLMNEQTKKSIEYLVVDNSDRVILSNIESYNNKLFSEIKFKKKNLTTKNFNINKTNWKIVSAVDNNQIYKETNTFLPQIIILGIFCIVLFVIVYYVVSNNITKPIFLMAREIKQIGNKNIKQRISHNYKAEFGVIAESINSMLDKIENITRKMINTQKKLYEIELVAKQAQISSLHSAINPHFLYNTLECIKSIGLVYGSSEIYDISNAMAAIYRYSIKEDDVVTIEKELNIVDEYLQIMNIRFRNKFTILKYVDEETYDLKIPKMIFQPIVENAFYHGLEKQNKEGILKISVNKKSDVLNICIEDNGIGFDKEHLKKINELLKNESDYSNINSKNGIGILNVAKKIKLYFGDNSNIFIESEFGKYTKVYMNIKKI